MQPPIISIISKNCVSGCVFIPTSSQAFTNSVLSMHLSSPPAPSTCSTSWLLSPSPLQLPSLVLLSCRATLLLSTLLGWTPRRGRQSKRSRGFCCWACRSLLRLAGVDIHE